MIQPNSTLLRCPLLASRNLQKLIITLAISNCFHFIDPNSTNCISGAAIDLSSLIVVEGKACWDLYIDGLVVSSDGNLLDALAAAVKVINTR